MPPSVSSTAHQTAPLVRLDRHPVIVPLLAGLNGYATRESDEPGQPLGMYWDLCEKWWSLARAKYRSDPAVECRVWADFFVANIHADTLDVLCHLIFGSTLAAMRGQGELRQRFDRVARLLGKSPFELFVWLGTEVSHKSNSLKSLASLLSPTGRYSIRPGVLLAELNVEMLRRHADNPASPPMLASIDITRVFRRYNALPPFGLSSAGLSSNVPSSAPASVRVRVTGTKRPVASLQVEHQTVADNRQTSAKRARLQVNEEEDEEDEDTSEMGREGESELSFGELSSGFSAQLLPLGRANIGAGAGAGTDEAGHRRDARIAILRSVLNFETPTAYEVGGTTAAFWILFRNCAESLMKVEEYD